MAPTKLCKQEVLAKVWPVLLLPQTMEGSRWENILNSAAPVLSRTNLFAITPSPEKTWGMHLFSPKPFRSKGTGITTRTTCIQLENTPRKGE